MPLGFSAPVGALDILDIVKFDAKAGRLIRVDRVDGQKMEEDITDDFAAVMDLANIQRGWAHFPPGAAPQWAMAHHSKPFPARPAGEEWKQGFRMKVLLARTCAAKPDDVRELAGTSGALKEAVGALFVAWEEHGSDPDALPIVKLDGTERRKTKHGPVYVPQFVIAKWIDRPAALEGAGETPDVEPAPAKPTPPATGSRELATDDIPF